MFELQISAVPEFIWTASHSDDCRALVEEAEAVGHPLPKHRRCRLHSQNANTLQQLPLCARQHSARVQMLVLKTLIVHR